LGRAGSNPAHLCGLCRGPDGLKFEAWLRPCFRLLFSSRARAGPKSPAHICSTLHLQSADATAGAQRNRNAIHCWVVSFMHRSCNATARLQPSGYDGLALQANPGPGPGPAALRVPSPASSCLCPASHPIPGSVGCELVLQTGIGRDPSCNRARMPSRRIAASIYQGGGGRQGGSRSPPSDDAPLPRSLPSASSATPVSSTATASTVSRTQTRTSPCSTSTPLTAPACDRPRALL
jgi:hypothetical protein